MGHVKRKSQKVKEKVTGCHANERGKLMLYKHNSRATLDTC